MSSLVIWSGGEVEVRWEKNGGYSVTQFAVPDESGVSPVVWRRLYADERKAVAAGKKRARISEQPPKPQ